MVPATSSTRLDATPSWRGWIHTVAFWLTPALAGTLIALAAFESGLATLGVSIYCASMAVTFGISALYHRRSWSERGWQVMRRLDHASIFVFIAGTYTPIGLLSVEGATRWWLLGVVWGGALGGVAMKLVWPHAPRWASVPVYIAVGWAAVFVLGDIAANAGVAALALLLAGGLLYTVGGILYALKRPNPRPDVFGYHEVFHLLTVLAAACQYIAVFFAVYGTPVS